MSPASADERGRPWLRYSTRDRAFLTVALMLVSMSSFMDRFVLSILLEPLATEFGLSDTQLGILSGFAFVFLYASLGIPVARWADRGNRRTIIQLSVVAWSAMTVLCGLAQSYWQLLVARLGVGIGEAGTLPPSHSLIGDLFAPDSRSTPLAFFTLGSSAGIAVGMMGGGYLAAEHGWRMAFIAVGAPGLLLALLVQLMVREPRLQGATLVRPVAPEKNLRAAVAVLLGKRSYRHLVLGLTVYFFVVGGGVLFMPSHLIRALGVPIDTVGFYFGLVTFLSAATGALIGGRLVDSLSKRDPRWMVRSTTICMVVVIPFFVGYMLTGSFTVAMVCYGVAWAVLTVGFPPIFASVQAVAGPSRRATAVAFQMLVATLLGHGLGPVAAGAISDALEPSLGVESLRYGLIVVFGLLLWAAAHFWRAERTFIEDHEDPVLTSITTPPRHRAPAGGAARGSGR